MQAPYVKSVSITLPQDITAGVRTVTTNISRTATPTDTSQPLTSWSETVTTNSKSSTRAYNGTTRTWTMQSPMGRQSTTSVDDAGRAKSIALPGVAEPLNFEYYADGRVKMVWQGTRTQTFEYAIANGRRTTTITNPLLERSVLERDDAGRLRTSTRADDVATIFDYDSNSNLTALTPPGRDPHGFAYNAVDLATKYTPPALSGTTSTLFYYNLDRQLTKTTRADGQLVTFAYDPIRGRLDSVTVPNGAIGFGYDPDTGKLDTITGPYGGSIGFDYNGPLLTGASFARGILSANVSWKYNTDLRVREESINNAHAIAFTYDNDGLLTSAGAMSLTPDPTSGTLSSTTVGSVTDSYSYDPAYGELSGYTASFDATALFNETITARDALGRIKTRSETVEGETHTYEYGYDLAGRLEWVERDDMVISRYAYVDPQGVDRNANRFKRITPSATITATYDAHDRLNMYGTKSYEYTLDGELETITDALTDRSNSFTYDALGNLTQAVVQIASGPIPLSKAIDYVVDGLGRRVRRDIGSSHGYTLLYQDALRPVAELNALGTVVSRFVYGTRVNIPDYVVRDGSTYRIITDHLGSLRLVVDAATGDVMQRMEYDEFGVVLEDYVASGWRALPFGFAGGIYDRDTKLVRFGARDYDALTGRWTSKDPIGFGGGDANLYGYVLADPISRTDASGLDALGFSVSGSFAGLGAGGTVGGGALFDMANPSFYRFVGGGGGASVGTGLGAGATGIYLWGETSDFFGAGYDFGFSIMNFAGGLLISDDGRIIGLWAGPQARGYDVHFWRTYTVKTAKDFEGGCGQTPAYYVPEHRQKGPY